MTDTEDICLRLEDILEQTGYVLDVVSRITKEEFLGSPLYSAAVVRYFEIIGEAAKHIPVMFGYNIRRSPGVSLQDFGTF